MNLDLTSHGRARMAQRAILPEDVELVVALGVEVADGYLMTEKACRARQHELRRQIAHLDRLAGKRVILAGDRVVTAYHATRKRARRLIRRAERRNLETAS